MRRSASIPFLLLVSVMQPGPSQGSPGQAEEPQRLQEVLPPFFAPTPGTATASSVGQSPFFGGVPSGPPQPGVLSLTLADAIHRGLKYNLGLLLAEEGTREARGARLRALSGLLPKVTAAVSEERKQVNLKAFGFPGLPGVPVIVGPFDVFDARASLSQSVFDLNAIGKARAGSEQLEAATYAYKDARDIVVLVCGNLYLQAIAGASRVEAARAQLKTAQAFYDQAVDMKKAGVSPGIDVLRAQVELQARQQRLIFFQNEFEKQKLSLARAIGLPIDQEFTQADRIPYTPPPPISLELASERAYRSRADYQRALSLVRGAEFAKRAARGEGLPSLHFSADYGDIGPVPGMSHGTFSMAGQLEIPLFQGGRVRGKVLEADALLRQRKSELEDLRARIAYEVRTALLDLKASGDQVQVAEKAVGLAREQVEQARDRFAAGVVSSIEVVQSQEAQATADENYISSLYSYNMAKATLARALGVAEASFKQLLEGSK